LSTRKLSIYVLAKSVALSRHMKDLHGRDEVEKVDRSGGEDRKTRVQGQPEQKLVRPYLKKTSMN
jgi:hypothetical protein